jgi:hypothetical protein
MLMKLTPNFCFLLFKIALQQVVSCQSVETLMSQLLWPIKKIDVHFNQRKKLKHD